MTQDAAAEFPRESRDARLLILKMSSIHHSAYQPIVESIHAQCPGVEIFHLPRRDQTLCETSPRVNLLDWNVSDDPLLPLMPESWYDQLRPIEGHALRMMDRSFEKIGIHSGKHGSFDYRRQEFLWICANWFQLLNNCNPTHVLSIDVPHHPIDYVGYHAARIRGARTAIAHHVKSGDARRLQHVTPIGAKRPRSSLDKTSYRFVCDGHDPLQILDERVPNWIYNSPYQASHTATSTTSALVAEVHPSPSAKRRHSDLLNLYKKRLRRPIGLQLRAVRGRLSLRKWSKEIHRIGKTPGINEMFAVYYLPYQPEASTSPRAGLYVEQSAAISLAVQALRGRLPLYVREHPDQFNRRRPRTLSLMNFLLRARDVYVLAPSVTSEWCLTHASLILSTPGSIVRQAWRAGVPVVQFGRSELSGQEGVLDEAFLLGLASGLTTLPQRRTATAQWDEVVRQAESTIQAGHLAGGPLDGSRSEEGLANLVSSLSWAVGQWISRQV